MIKQIAASIVLFVSCIAPSFAAEPAVEEVVPEHEDSVTNVSAETLATMITTDASILIVDARIQKGREKGYIEGSIALPDVETSCNSLAKHIPNKTTKVVFYCTSSKCGRSLNSIRIAKDCKYTDLYWFRGGFEEWTANGFPYKK